MGIVGAATLTSRLLGVARDAVLARFFGAGDAMDAYNVAFRIPNFVRDLFAEGAMSSAFVPTFTATLAAEGRERAWRLGNLVINALVVTTSAVVLAGIVFAPWLLADLAGGFASTPGKLELTLLLSRIMLPFLTLVAIAAACMGMLNSLGRFFVPALSPAMFNVATIFCAFALIPVMPRFGLEPIVAIAIGTLLGGAGQVVTQWIQLRREGFRYQPVLSFRDEKVRQMLLLMAPATIGLAATQVNLAVNTALATSEGTGAVSYLGYAFRLMYLPIGLFGVSVATAVTPMMARHAANTDLPSMRSTISSGLRLMLMLNVPATVGLAVLGAPIVSVIFERQAFSAADTAATAGALMFYAPGLVGYSAVKIAAPAFYSLGSSRIPVIVSVLSMVANITLSLALVRLLGYRGLALGSALAALFNATMLLWLLRGRLGGLDGWRVAIALVKIVAASAVMGVAAWYAHAWLTSIWPQGPFLVRTVQLFASIGLAILALAAAAVLLRIREFSDAVTLVTRRFRRRSATPAHD